MVISVSKSVFQSARNSNESTKVTVESFDFSYRG
jgi:hypothetical protein